MSGFVIAKLGACAALGTEASGLQAEVIAGTSAFEHRLGPRGAVTVVALETLAIAEPRAARRRALLEHALADLLDGLSWEPGRVALVHASAAEEGTELEDRVVQRAREAGQQIASVHGARHARASWFMALVRARELLDEGRCEAVLVFASDSRCDRETLAALARACETLGDDNRDGLIPGEGACVALCCLPDAPLAGLPTAIACEQLAIGREPNPFAGSEPSISTGLTSLFRSLSPSPPVDVVVDCQTGQARFTKEFHAAYLRCVERMPEPLVRTSTAGSFGDAGAATGGLAMILAQLELATRARALAYASDDDGQLGGAVLARSGGGTALRERLERLWARRQVAPASAFHQRQELIEDHLDTCGYLVLDRFDDLVSGQTPWRELDGVERRIQAQLDALALGGRSTIERARAGLGSGAGVRGAVARQLHAMSNWAPEPKTNRRTRRLGP
ncbi:3-oxoacyl-(acyl carrier protein) synthase [Enhygromyxa salina]|uniref:3-oxoacyl-(Acyl carrier protein) synthase n=1 Tax=Enhygromyxa salina TaxID=215803 RepID=A0A2S9XS51_9BACT|nr:hypothetical protein [Enhygromyxa salina]PRP95531.1 3-oxoacyl-(acyl carrier protein) synthase [Enhygromyxa salina]